MPGPFGAETTTEEVLEGVDLSGKRVLVTGVSAGLGVETARAAASHGAAVVGTARDPGKAAAALAEHADLGIEVVACDLASLASVRACADALLARGGKFDVIIANAGVMNCPQGETADHFETQFGTNHLGHFVLLGRLLPLIADGGRVVMLSSSAHRAGNIDLDDPGFAKTKYDAFTAYGRSKTANVLFAVELDRRRPRGIRATALHPGGIMTELMRHTTPDIFQRMVDSSSQSADGTPSEPVKVKTVPQGAATSVWAAFVASGDEVGGRYCEDCHVGEVEDNAYKGVRSYAVDPASARALWAKSEDMVGERFPA